MTKSKLTHLHPPSFGVHALDMLAIVGVLFGSRGDAVVKINSHNIVASMLKAVIARKLAVRLMDGLFGCVEGLERVEADEEVVLGSSRDIRGSGSLE